jgi:hypothetical protein
MKIKKISSGAGSGHNDDVKQLRDFEMAFLGPASLSVKSSDDASAVTWRSGRAILVSQFIYGTACVVKRSFPRSRSSIRAGAIDLLDHQTAAAIGADYR